MKTSWNDPDGGFHPASAPDFLPRRELEQLQLGRLLSVVGLAYERVSLFRQRMEERRLTPASIRSLADLAHLPFTVKTDLRDTYPFGLFATPMSQVVRLHATSGTTGKPIVVAYTEEDVQVWSSVMVRSFAACGISPGRHHPERLRLRPVHRRSGRALRRRGPGRHRHPHLRRQHRAAAHGDGRLRRHRHLLHAVLLHPPHRAGQGGQDRLRQAPGGRVRRRALVGGDAGVHPVRDRDQGLRHLRPVRDHRPGRGRRVHPPPRAAHLRGPLLPGDHRPGDRRGPARRHRGRAGPDHALQAGHAHDPLPDPGHHRHRSRALRLRPDPAPHPPHRPPHRRHVHHPRRQRVPVAGRDGAPGRRGHAAALPDRPHPREGAGRDGGAGGGHARGLLGRDPAAWRRSRRSWVAPSSTCSASG